MIIEIDPALIDNSFVADRMESSEEQSAAFRDLIRQYGQNVPILVRPNLAPKALRGCIRPPPPEGGARTRN